VIRQELASPSGAGKERRRRRAVGLADPDDELDFGELCERAAITSELARELEEYGLLQPRRVGSEKLYPAGDVDVAVACAKLSRFGISGRHLRTFRTAADREAGLLQQLVAPSLRSRNPERREAAVQQLQTLAELAQELSQLLFWRDLRQLAGN
jgi:DNA-binding transcriptional MerR regulator